MKPNLKVGDIVYYLEDYNFRGRITEIYKEMAKVLWLPTGVTMPHYSLSYLTKIYEPLEIFKELISK